MKRLEAMTSKELGHLMVMAGRAILETAKGLDVEEPRFMLVMFSHPAQAQYASNAPPEVGKEALCCLLDRLNRRTAEIGMVGVYQKPSMKEEFLSSMPTFFEPEGARALTDTELCSLVHCFAMGWGTCLLVNQGVESYRQWGFSYPELRERDWKPDHTWRWIK